MKYLVRSPNPKFEGLRAGVMFTNGKAIVDSTIRAERKALGYFQRREGYTVTPLDEPEQTEDAPEPETLAKPAKSATKAAWKAFAVDQGMSEEDASKATRDELAVFFTEEEGAEA